MAGRSARHLVQSGLAAVLVVAAMAPGCTAFRPPVATTTPEPAAQPRPPAPPPPASAPVDRASEADVPEGVFHRVEPGQTLWRIARAYGVSWEELADVNHVPDPTALDAGTMLFVPGGRMPLEVAPYPAPPPEPGRTSREVIPTAGGSFCWPIPGGEILSRFGAPRRGRKHAGLDIRGAAGEGVLAAGGGEVVYSDDTLRGYGKMVIVDHGDGLQTLYAHNSELLVRVGDVVERGQRLAKVGRTGNASTEHCHFEVRKGNVPVDPLGYLAAEGEVASAEGHGRDAPRAEKSVSAGR